MQPCPACGGVTIGATGHCTRCGTYRANPPQDPAGGYGAYQQPVGGPGHQPTNAPGYLAGGARPFVVPLVALSATLVVLVIAIVIVVIVRSGGQTGTPVADRSTPAAGPTAEPANPDVDPCVVGRWRVTSHREDVAMEDVGEVTFTGGRGALVDLAADGAGRTTYSATSFTGTAGGQEIRLEFNGTLEFDFTARDGTVSFKNMQADGTAKGYVDGEEVVSDPLSGSDDPAKYTCSGSTMTQSTATYETAYARVR
jgi:hypothetical protein